LSSNYRRSLVRIIKLAGSVLFYGGAVCVRRVRAVLGKKSPPGMVVLTYHHVFPEERDRFAKQLDHLQRWTSPVSIDQRNLDAGPHYTMLTVDDGWLSFAENAVPEVLRRNIPLTLFAVSHRLGANIDDIARDRLVSEDQLRELAAQNIKIGSHTANHALLTDLGTSDAWRELVESREKLSALTGTAVDSFCFPYGEYSLELADLAHQAGYRHVFTSIPYLGDYTEYAIPRVRVDPTDWMLEFHLKIMGAYDWISQLIILKRRLTGSAARAMEKWRSAERSHGDGASLEPNTRLEPQTGDSAKVDSRPAPETPLSLKQSL
jgi:peptidoglycan/xylan/chitin deacetylase (PgdA/CDA1 family)